MDCLNLAYDIEDEVRLQSAERVWQRGSNEACQSWVRGTPGFGGHLTQLLTET